MKVFTSTDFPSLYVGGAAVIVAANKHTAKRMLIKKVESRADLFATVKVGWKQRISVQEVTLTKPRAIIIKDGDY